MDGLPRHLEHGCGTCRRKRARRTFSSASVEFKDGKAHIRTCFTAGTLIHTKEGLKVIEDIQIGDVVMSKSDVTGEVSYKKVVNTFIRQAPRIYKLTYKDGTSVETTGDHPFFIQGKGWTTADLLENGDISPTWAGLKKSDGVVEKEVVFSSSKDIISDRMSGLVFKESLAVVDIEVIEEETTVYNFEVEDDHTYFVTDAAVWVHNADDYMKTNIELASKSKSNFDLAKAKYKEINSFESLGFVESLIQRISNYSDGFKTDKDIIDSVVSVNNNEFDNEYLKLKKTIELGYKLSVEDERKYLAYQFKDENNISRISIDQNNRARIINLNLYGETMILALAPNFSDTISGIDKEFNNTKGLGPTKYSGISPEDVIKSQSSIGVGRFLRASIGSDVESIIISGLGRSGGDLHSPSNFTAIDFTKVNFKNQIGSQIFDSKSPLKMGSEPNYTRVFIGKLAKETEFDGRTQYYNPYSMNNNIWNQKDSTQNNGTLGIHKEHLNHAHWGFELNKDQREYEKKLREYYGVENK